MGEYRLTNDNVACLGVGLVCGASIAISPLTIPIVLGVAAIAWGVFREVKANGSKLDSTSGDINRSG